MYRYLAATRLLPIELLCSHEKPLHFKDGLLWRYPCLRKLKVVIIRQMFAYISQVYDGRRVWPCAVYCPIRLWQKTIPRSMIYRPIVALHTRVAAQNTGPCACQGTWGQCSRARHISRSRAGLVIIYTQERHTDRFTRTWLDNYRVTWPPCNVGEGNSKVLVEQSYLQQGHLYYNVYSQSTIMWRLYTDLYSPQGIRLKYTCHTYCIPTHRLTYMYRQTSIIFTIAEFATVRAHDTGTNWY
jgi:hypothetical protein